MRQIFLWDPSLYSARGDCFEDSRLTLTLDGLLTGGKSIFLEILTETFFLIIKEPAVEMIYLGLCNSTRQMSLMSAEKKTIFQFSGS